MKLNMQNIILAAAIALTGVGCGGDKIASSSSAAISSSSQLVASSSSFMTSSSSAISSSSSSVASSSRPSSSSIASSVAASSIPAMVGRYPNYNTNPVAPNMNGMGSTAQQIANKIKLGWNLGNTMEAFYTNAAGELTKPDGVEWENSWGNASASSALFASVKQSGFDAVRLPISWDVYANQTTAEIDQNWLDHVEQVVQYAIDNDLYVLLNIHYDKGWLEKKVNQESKDAVNDKQFALWTQIATQLRDFDERVMFASANEPDVEVDSNNPQVGIQKMSVLLSYHQTFVNAVRATGGKNAYRTLVVQGPTTSAEKTYNLMNKLPTDTVANRMMVEVHSYTPYLFTLMENPNVNDWVPGITFYPIYYWGNGNLSTTDTIHNADANSQESAVDQEMSWMKEKYTSKGIPVILGEYAAMYRGDQVPASELQRHKNSRNYWHKYVTQKALQNGLIPFYWDAGTAGKFGTGLFDRDYNTRNDSSHAKLVDTETMNALKQGAGK